MNDKIMSLDALEATEARLRCCIAMLDVLHDDMEDCGNRADAVAGVCYLLDATVGVFRAHIDNAEDYAGKKVEA